MSDMTPYFQSLERAADLACAVSETLQAHPNAVVRYKDEEVNNELIAALTDLESAIADPDSYAESGKEEQTLDSLFSQDWQEDQPGYF